MDDGLGDFDTIAVDPTHWRCGAATRPDGPLLESMAVDGKVPSLALLVRVQEAMFHCGKSMIRSHMWEPELWGPVDGLPTYGRALVDHGQLGGSVEEMEEIVDLNEKYRLYDE